MQQQDQSKRAETVEDRRNEEELDSARIVREDEEELLVSASDASAQHDETTSVAENDELPVEAEQAQPGDAATASLPDRFNLFSLALVLLIAACFALATRLNSQPAPSFVPAAMLSATGCGLLVTALRKLRGRTGAGLLAALLCGFCLALFQFAVALTYPGVVAGIVDSPADGRAFLLTWGLVGLFAIALSVGGAALGHLAFAPLRPLPARASRSNPDDEDDENDDDEALQAPDMQQTQRRETHEYASASSAEAEGDEEAEDESAIPDERSGSAVVESDDDDEAEAEDDADTDDDEDDEDDEGEKTLVAPTAGHALINYAIMLLLIGLLPMVAGYVFAAAYDFLMNTINVNQFSPGLYPTLSLLSGLLPWRLPATINLTGINGSFIIFTVLWRIPDSFLGNPSPFDIQTLEPMLFNASALALLLLTMYRRTSWESKARAATWSVFLLLEFLLGLFLVFSPDLWMLQGLEGILQTDSLAVQLPTIYFLNSTMFLLNLLTGPLFCLLVGVIVRRQYQLWHTPREVQTSQKD